MSIMYMHKYYIYFKKKKAEKVSQRQCKLIVVTPGRNVMIHH